MARTGPMFPTLTFRWDGKVWVPTEPADFTPVSIQWLRAMRSTLEDVKPKDGASPTLLASVVASMKALEATITQEA